MNEGVEIAADVAAAPQSVITEQVTNGVAVRMALLYLLAGHAAEAGPSARASGSRRSVDLEISRAWLVGPGGRPRGPGRGRRARRHPRGRHAGSTATTPTASAPTGVVVAPGLHRPARPPPRAGQRGRGDGRDGPRGRRARRVHDRLRDAEHDARARRAGGGRRGSAPPRPRRGSPVGLLAHGAVTAGRAGETLAAARRAGRCRRRRVLATTARRSRSASILRNALAYAGALGLPIVDHPEDPTLTDGAEANDGLRRDGARPAGLAGRGRGDGRSRATSRSSPTSSRDVPGARLHLTHVSTAGALDARPAREGGRAAGHLRRDAAPPRAHRRVGRRRAPALGAGDGDGGDPWARRRDRRRAVRHVAPRQPAAPLPEDAAACLAALLDGTADAIATDHAPHTEVDKARRVRAGGERDQRHRDGARGRAGGGRRRPAAAGAGDRGADDRPGPGAGGRRGAPGRSGSSRASRPTSSSSIAATRWTVEPEPLASQGKNTPLLGRDAAGRVLLTVAGGRLAYEAPDAWTRLRRRSLRGRPGRSRRPAGHDEDP